MKYIKTLQEIFRGEYDLVGERALDLALLSRKGYETPLSFVITNQTFEEFITENNLRQRIGKVLLNKSRVYDDVRELILEGKFSKEMVREIVDAYESLRETKNGSASSLLASNGTPFVNMMLSPNYTSPTENTEGIILNVCGLEELLLAVKECWACLFTPTMRRFRQDANINESNLNCGVIVQFKPRSEVTAEVWSATQRTSEEITVKSYFGALDIGVGIAKDEWRVTREYLKPVFQSVVVQESMLTNDENDKLGKALIGDRGEEQKISDREMIEIARLAKKASSILDDQVKLVFDVVGEKMQLILCNRLLLTKGSVKLQRFELEEKIDEISTEVSDEDVEGDETGDETSDTPEVSESLEESEGSESEVKIDNEVEEDTEHPIQKDDELDEEGVVDEDVVEEVDESGEEAEDSGEEGKDSHIQKEVIETETAEIEVDEDNYKQDEHDGIDADKELGDADKDSDKMSGQETDKEPDKEPDQDSDNKVGAESEGGSIFDTVEGVDQEGEEEPASETLDESAPSWTLDSAYEEVTNALRNRYEHRFRTPPPSTPLLFLELKDEIHIPYEDRINKLLKIKNEEVECDDSEKEKILSIIDNFLKEFGEEG